MNLFCVSFSEITKMAKSQRKCRPGSQPCHFLPGGDPSWRATSSLLFWFFDLLFCKEIIIMLNQGLYMGESSAGFVLFRPLCDCSDEQVVTGRVQVDQLQKCVHVENILWRWHAFPGPKLVSKVSCLAHQYPSMLPLQVPALKLTLDTPQGWQILLVQFAKLSDLFFTKNHQTHFISEYRFGSSMPAW